MNPVDPALKTIGLIGLADHHLPNLRPTPDEIDAIIADYDSGVRMVKAAQEVADDLKTRLIHMVETHGEMPPTATASKRLAGRHNEAIVTAAKVTSVNESAVADFHAFLKAKYFGGLFERFFATQTKHTIVEGARDVLKQFDVPTRIEEKMLQLFGLCIEVKPKAPSLKIGIIEPEKPARAPRDKKGAA